MIYTYQDEYLKARMTDDREGRALAAVNAIGTFADDWIEKLTVLRAYIIVCLECQAQADDLFAQKLANYRKEWDAVLQQARAATPDPETGKRPSIFTVALERA
jgi:hypothetical protein